jgi:hypothetical protein
MTNGATLIYDRTVSNQHGYYNTRTGIFTAPSNGMYAFTWTQGEQRYKMPTLTYNRKNSVIIKNTIILNIILYN